jgi:hypothetical protein
LGRSESCQGTRRAAVAAVVLSALTLVGCGIPTGPPSAIPAGQVPPNLVSPNPSVTTSTIVAGAVRFNVYLFNASLTLTGYQRFLNVKAAALNSILEILVTGPSPSEALFGVSTSIPADTAVLSVSGPVNNVVTVNFSDALTRVTGTSQVQAVEQVVFTIDNAPSIPPSTAVLFEIDGLPIAVPKGNGVETNAPVSATDYPAATTTTTLPVPTASPSLG